MKKILTYHRDNKGITIVMIALILVVLLMFLGMAVDIAYMYVVKNQLQVAADAAALAGVAELDGSFSTQQLAARQRAWQFACRNRATGDPVYLVTNSPSDCNTPPGSGLNEGGNDPNGDIVIGNWDPTRSSAPADLRFLPIPGTPLPVGAIINAVKVVPRRTGETPGMPQVGVFWGQIFRMIGGDWSRMSARATAIATMPPRATSFVAVGNQFCPAVGNPNCCPPETGSTYPATCNLCTPRELFAEPTTVPPPEKIGWTSLLDRPGSTSEFEDLLCGTSPAEDICPPVPGIWGVPGTTAATFKDLESIMCDPGFDAGSKDIDPSTGKITGWEVSIPIVDRTDPMSAPDPNPVLGYAKVHIIAICSPGSPGCRGAGSCISSSYCSGGAKKIVIDRIQCIFCGTFGGGLKPALVK